MHRRIWLVFATVLALFAGDINEELLEAARKGDLAAVKALVEKGAALETKTSYGQTPLYLAAMKGHEQVVEFLLDKGANTEVRDTFYKFPMLGATIMLGKNYGIAKMLIAKGNGSPDENLAAVAGTGNVDLAQAVLEKGKPSQASLDKTYEAALDRKQTALAELLKKAGAQEPAPALQVDAKALESYAGTYKADGFPLDIKVFVKAGKLYMQPTGQGEFAPKPKSPTVFEFPPAQLVVEFDSASGFTLKQMGQNIKFKKAVAQ
jgi:Ankyrin repeats (3 copies)